MQIRPDAQVRAVLGWQQDSREAVRAAVWEILAEHDVTLADQTLEQFVDDLLR